MPSDESGAAAAMQLHALDRILAGEPVDEEHLELAALVESVRASAPRMSDTFAADLERRLQHGSRRRAPRGGGPRSLLRIPRLPRRLLAGAGASLAVAAVALVVVIATGITEGPAHPVARVGAALPSSASSSASPSAPAQAGSATGSSSNGAAAGPAVSGLQVPSPTVASSAAARLEQRAAALTLVTSAASLQGVADSIVTVTEQLGGIVESSNVNVQGDASQAAFSLNVPSARLAQVIASLSRLAHVGALSQSTQDITDAYGQAQAQLAASRAQRDALLAALARATTPNQTASLRAQLDAIAGRIAGQLHAVDSLQGQARSAMLQVTVVAGAVVARPDPAPGPLRRGAHDALHVLEVALAVALIALAVLLPLGLAVAAVALGTRALRGRQRERALERM